MTKDQATRLAEFTPGSRVVYVGSPRSVANAAKHFGRKATVVKTIKSRNEVVCDWLDGQEPRRFYAFAESLELASVSK